MGKQARINAASKAAMGNQSVSKAKKPVFDFPHVLPVRCFNPPQGRPDVIFANDLKFNMSRGLFNAIHDNSPMAKIAKKVKVITIDGELIDDEANDNSYNRDYVNDCLIKFFSGVYEENFVDESEKEDFDAGIQHGLKGDYPLTGYYRNAEYLDGELLMVSIAGDSIAVCYYRNQ